MPISGYDVLFYCVDVKVKKIFCLDLLLHWFLETYILCNFTSISFFRFICGTQDIHKQLEDQIATFHGRDEAILYASCFDANAGFFEALLTNVSSVVKLVEYSI